MALWRNDAFVLFADVSIIGLLAKERRGTAEVNAHRQEDGDIEHTQEKYVKMTHSCEKKIDLCYATAKIPQRGRKKQSRCRMRGRKRFPYGKTANRRCNENAQRRKSARK